MMNIFKIGEDKLHLVKGTKEGIHVVEELTSLLMSSLRATNPQAVFMHPVEICIASRPCIDSVLENYHLLGGKIAGIFPRLFVRFKKSDALVQMVKDALFQPEPSVTSEETLWKMAFEVIDDEDGQIESNQDEGEIYVSAEEESDGSDGDEEEDEEDDEGEDEDDDEEAEDGEED